MKAQLRALANRQGVTASALVNQWLAGVVRKERVEHAHSGTEKVRRNARLYVRLEPKDWGQLRERSQARCIPAATYVSVLVRAHLRSIAPLPKAEYLALRRSLTELAAIGRNLNQIARAANQGATLTLSQREGVDALLKVTGDVRDEVRALLTANERSWLEGERRAPSGSR
jgi:hypothetical protein